VIKTSSIKSKSFCNDEPSLDIEKIEFFRQKLAYFIQNEIVITKIRESSPRFQVRLTTSKELISAFINIVYQIITIIPSLFLLFFVTDFPIGRGSLIPDFNPKKKAGILKKKSSQTKTKNQNNETVH
jgi:hypothetical protein